MVMARVAVIDDDFVGHDVTYLLKWRATNRTFGKRARQTSVCSDKLASYVIYWLSANCHRWRTNFELGTASAVASW